MKRNNILVGSILFVLGFIGVLSTLTMKVNLPQEVEQLLLAQFSPTQIKILLLINPTILLLVAVVTGTLLYRKVDLSVPTIEKLLNSAPWTTTFLHQLTAGWKGGAVAGVLVVIVSLAFESVLSDEFKEMEANIKPSVAVRFLYGGITEEILLRFGLMTFLVWLGSRLTRSNKAFIYWLAIVLAAVIFALSHFPIVYQTVESPSIGLLSYILIGNSIGGFVFGLLYWKKGLEAAFVAHITLHVVLLLAESILHL